MRKWPAATKLRVWRHPAITGTKPTAVMRPAFGQSLHVGLQSGPGAEAIPLLLQGLRRHLVYPYCDPAPSQASLAGLRHGEPQPAPSQFPSPRGASSPCFRASWETGQGVRGWL